MTWLAQAEHFEHRALRSNDLLSEGLLLIEACTALRRERHAGPTVDETRTRIAHLALVEWLHRASLEAMGERDDRIRAERYRQIQAVIAAAAPLCVANIEQSRYAELFEGFGLLVNAPLA